MKDDGVEDLSRSTNVGDLVFTGGTDIVAAPTGQEFANAKNDKVFGIGRLAVTLT